jgi:hypothetical protein
MHDTAEGLERSEATLHDAADRSPDAETSRRLDALGDEVTRRAKEIDKRATHLDPAGSETSEGVSHLTG